jgi:hypothetical protein
MQREARVTVVMAGMALDECHYREGRKLSAMWTRTRSTGRRGRLPLQFVADWKGCQGAAKGAGVPRGAELGSQQSRAAMASGQAAAAEYNDGPRRPLGPLCCPQLPSEGASAWHSTDDCVVLCVCGSVNEGNEAPPDAAAVGAVFGRLCEVPFLEMHAREH